MHERVSLAPHPYILLFVINHYTDIFKVKYKCNSIAILISIFMGKAISEISVLKCIVGYPTKHSETCNQSSKHKWGSIRE